MRLICWKKSEVYNTTFLQNVKVDFIFTDTSLGKETLSWCSWYIWKKKKSEAFMVVISYWNDSAVFWIQLQGVVFLGTLSSEDIRQISWGLTLFSQECENEEQHSPSVAMVPAPGLVFSDGHRTRSFLELPYTNFWLCNISYNLSEGHLNSKRG